MRWLFGVIGQKGIVELFEMKLGPRYHLCEPQ